MSLINPSSTSCINDMVFTGKNYHDIQMNELQCFCIIIRATLKSRIFVFFHLMHRTVMQLVKQNPKHPGHFSHF